VLILLLYFSTREFAYIFICIYQLQLGLCPVAVFT
jgi:hypothetical protein